MQSVLETPIFSRRADALLSREERAELIWTLAHNPLAGDLIPGTGGVRKLRFGAGHRAKRGGFRVVYYVLHDDLPILAIILYGKNEQADLSPEEKRGAHSIVAALKAELARRTNR
jgi:mRNA-degrading endonuclease RelE of RelBE toxin-antitoxin system